METDSEECASFLLLMEKTYPRKYDNECEPKNQNLAITKKT